MNSWEYVQKLGVGWNLGNTLDARPKDDDSPRGQETAWRNPVTSFDMIKTVKSAGFDIFRVPVSWCKQMGPAPHYNIKNEWLKRVKQVVDYGINNGMKVILNLHHEDWHFPSDENFPAASEILKKVWVQIAGYFGSYDSSLMFEAMNEPRKENTDVEWIGGDEESRRVVMKLNQVFVDTVRSMGGHNQQRMLLVPTYAASCAEIAMKDFEMPKGENLIASLHGYIPYPFALGDKMELNKWSGELEKDIDDLFVNIDKYFLSKKIPVIMGECGARRKGDNEADRAAWADYYTGKARKHGVPCIWWDNGYSEGSDTTEVFGLLNRLELKWDFPKIVRSFTRTN